MELRCKYLYIYHTNEVVEPAAEQFKDVTYLNLCPLNDVGSNSLNLSERFSKRELQVKSPFVFFNHVLRDFDRSASKSETKMVPCIKIKTAYCFFFSCVILTLLF